MNQLKKLTWKYFFQQKWQEIGWYLIPISIIIGVLLIGFGLGSYPIENEIYSMKMIVWGLSIFCFWLLIGTIKLIKVFCKWIRSNWQKAAERAIHELNDGDLPSEDVEKVIVECAKAFEEEVRFGGSE